MLSLLKKSLGENSLSSVLTNKKLSKRSGDSSCVTVTLHFGDIFKLTDFEDVKSFVLGDSIITENVEVQIKKEGSFTIYSSNSTGCVTTGTLITLADGSQVPVEKLTGDELLLVWNLETGKYDSAPMVFIDSDPVAEYEIIHAYFEDGTDVEIISEHGFFDLELKKYVYFDVDAAQYIGHTFVKQAANGKWTTTKLADVVIEHKVTGSYSPVTFSHLCYYVNGMLSMPGGITGLFNIYDVDTVTMKYDAKAKAADIAKYGLYTYADFESFLPEEMFYAFNGADLKVAIEKGLLTWDDIFYLAERYTPIIAPPVFGSSNCR